MLASDWNSKRLLIDWERYLLTLDSYVVWIAVARSTMHPLLNNVQLGEDLKQKGNLPHAGNNFTLLVPPET